MSIIAPPSHSENADASGASNAPRIVSRRSSVPIVGALAAALSAAILASSNSIRRLDSSPDAMFVVAKTFAGAVVGGALGAMIFAPVDLSWAGLVSGGALGAAYAIGEHPPSR
jgi:hypothetical protein